jgi:hypothetical protein
VVVTRAVAPIRPDRAPAHGPGEVHVPGHGDQGAPPEHSCGGAAVNLVLLGPTRV